jgi:hypothetical protein
MDREIERRRAVEGGGREREWGEEDKGGKEKRGEMVQVERGKG